MNASINKNEFSFKLPEMLSYHSTWDDADYEPSLPRRRSGWTAALASWLRARAERRRVMMELQQMSDRELADIGLSRFDIPRVFDPAFSLEREGRI